MDRKRIALYSYLALLVALVGVFVRFLFADPYSDQPAGLGYAFPILLLLTSIHLLYFRRELAEIRQGWVERRPWLRHFITTEPQSLSLRMIVLSLGWAILAFVLLTIWIMFVRV